MYLSVTLVNKDGNIQKHKKEACLAFIRYPDTDSDFHYSKLLSMVITPIEEAYNLDNALSNEDIWKIHNEFQKTPLKELKYEFIKAPLDRLFSLRIDTREVSYAQSLLILNWYRVCYEHYCIGKNLVEWIDYETKRITPLQKVFLAHYFTVEQHKNNTSLHRVRANTNASGHVSFLSYIPFGIGKVRTFKKLLDVLKTDLLDGPNRFLDADPIKRKELGVIPAKDRTSQYFLDNLLKGKEND